MGIAPSCVCIHNMKFANWRLLASGCFALLIFFITFGGIIKVIQFFRFIHLNFFGPSVFVLAGTVVNASFRAALLLFQNTGKGALRISINF